MHPRPRASIEGVGAGDEPDPKRGILNGHPKFSASVISLMWRTAHNQVKHPDGIPPALVQALERVQLGFSIRLDERTVLVSVRALAMG